MLVQIKVAFENPTAEDEVDLRSVALTHTSDKESVRVFNAASNPRWLVATFEMKREPQIQIVDRLDRSIRFTLWNREDSIIAFPKPKKGRTPP